MTSANQYVLSEASDLELIRYTRLRNSDSWKGQLSPEDYMVREHVLGQAKIASSNPNRLLVFVLRKVGDSTPLASCELLIRKSWSFELQDSKVVKKDILSACVGGVFSYPENRGQGLAKLMIDKLVELSRSEKYVGPDGFTFLYSEIGEFYAKSGFKSFEVPLSNFSVDDYEDGVDVSGTKVEPIQFHQFGEFFEYQNAQFERETAAKVLKDGKTRVAVTPVSDIVDWFHLRSKYISYKMFHEKKDPAKIDFLTAPFKEIANKFEDLNPNTFGLKLLNKSDEWIGSIAFTIDWNGPAKNYATIIKTVVVDGQDKDLVQLQLIKSLKQYLRTSTETPGQVTTKIVLWESEISKNALEVIRKNWKGEHGLANSSMSAILIHNDEDNEKAINGDLIWAGNDKLPWF